MEVIHVMYNVAFALYLLHQEPTLGLKLSIKSVLYVFSLSILCNEHVQQYIEFELVYNIENVQQWLNFKLV